MTGRQRQPLLPLLRRSLSLSTTNRQTALPIGVSPPSLRFPWRTVSAELRLQLAHEQTFDAATINFVTDLMVDPVLDINKPNLETGQGVVDLRQLNLLFSPLDSLDIKLGRQIITWGTGDLLFDLFAKNFQAFFMGRDTEYLKAPTDAAKISLFTNPINIDMIYVPKFNADRYINRKRLSFFDRATHTFRGKENPVLVDQPETWFDDNEIAIRLYRHFDNIETAFYYYQGFWKSPAAINAQSGVATFPELQVFGASLRTPFATGIANMELGYYHSKDIAKLNPLSRNSEF